jgi:hypothetical protein
MNRILVLRYSLLLSILFSFGFKGLVNNPKDSGRLIRTWEQHVHSSYSCLQDTSLSKEAFDYGLRGYYTLLNEEKIENEKYLTIVDFTQHSSRERFYVIDMETFEIKHKTLCSHGKNTGGATADIFSNRSGSLQSSLGFFIANETYSGKFKYAMRLDGLESVNFRARDRGIVVHGAEYATREFLQRNENVLGRSYGCPALPKDESTDIINSIKEGSCFFIYAGKSAYERSSKLIQPDSFLSTIKEFI